MNSEASRDAPTVKRTKSGGGRAFHSRLEPFVEFIRQQRLKRKTWKEIAKLLCVEKACAITFQGLHQFYRRYVIRQNRPHWERAWTSIAPQPAEPTRHASQASTPPAPTFRQPTPDRIQLNDLTHL